MDDEYFTIPYITDTIPNSPSGHKLPIDPKKNVWIVHINGEDPITDQGALYELNCHQNPCGKSKVKISLCIIKSYQRTDLEEICSRFVPDLIKSDLWFHILDLVSQINIPPQITLVNI